MPVLFHAKTKETIHQFESIKAILEKHGILLEKWDASKPLTTKSTQEEILEAYSHKLKPFMELNQFQSADVINVHPETENILGIREKFMKEHTHSDDEIRFFVDGVGKFWFNLENNEILCLTCTAGDFISVPKNFKHWFDLHPQYSVKAIRIFSNMEGWVPNYTNSNIDESYNP